MLTRRHTTTDHRRERGGSERELAYGADVGVQLFNYISAPICMQCRNKQESVPRGGVEHEGLYLYVLCGYFYMLLILIVIRVYVQLGMFFNCFPCSIVATRRRTTVKSAEGRNGI